MLSLLWDIYRYMYCTTADDEVYRLYIYIYICTDADEKNSVSTNGFEIVKVFFSYHLVPIELMWLLS